MLNDQRPQICLIKRDFLSKSITKKTKHKPISAKTSSDTNKAYCNSLIFTDPSLKLFQHRLFYSITQQSLIVKYNITPDRYSIIMMEHLLQSKYCRALAAYKEKLLYNYTEEFLKRFYRRKESTARLPKCFSYFKNYQEYFCTPIYREMFMNELMLVKGERKARVYYSHNLKKSKGVTLKSDKAVGEEVVIFNSTVKKMICPLNDESVIPIKNDFNEPLFIDSTMNEIVNELKERIEATPAPKVKLPCKKVILLKKKSKKKIQTMKEIESRNKMQTIIQQSQTKEKFVYKVSFTDSNKKDIPRGNTQEGTIEHVYLKTDITRHYKPISFNKENLLKKVKLKINPIHNKNVFSLHLEKARGITVQKKKLSFRIKDNTNPLPPQIATRQTVHTEGNKIRLKSLNSFAKTSSRNTHNELYSGNTQLYGGNIPNYKHKEETVQLPGFRGKSLKIKKRR